MNNNFDPRHHSPSPPDAARRPHEITVHGHTRVDDYYWLRDRHDPAVIAYLEAENRYTEQKLAHTTDLQQTLYDEMVSRIKETDQTVPERIGDYDYYSRTEKGKEYSIYCRRVVSPGSPEEVLLDLNALAAHHSFLRLGIYKVSPDHQTLAYSLDTSGSEAYTIYFKDLRSGELRGEQIERTDYSAEWSADSQALYYTTFDDARRSDRVWRHRLGSEPGSDQILYHEADELYRVFLYKTKDRRFIVLLVRSLETGEVHVLPADSVDAPFRLVEARSRGIRYHVRSPFPNRSTPSPKTRIPSSTRTCCASPISR